MRVAVDATPLLVQPTGVGGFVHGLMGGLLRDHDLELTAYAVSGRNGKRLRQVVPAPVKVAHRRATAAISVPLWKRFDFPSIERYTGATDVVHATNVLCPPTKAKTVVTVHDLTSVRFPELCDGVSRDFPLFIRRAIDHGATIHTPSAFVASEVREHFSVAPDRVVVIPHGSPLHATVGPEHERTVAEVTKGNPYVLAVGTIEPRKDYTTLIRAFRSISDAYDDLSLVIAGAPGWDSENVKAVVEECKLTDRVVFLGYVEEHMRAALFQSATVFVYPSLYEGFGFPPLEAMRTHTPVVATRAGAVPEVCGNAALFVDVGDADQMGDALRRTLSDEQLRAQLVTDGNTRLAHYDWGITAQQMGRLYKEVGSRS